MLCCIMLSVIMLNSVMLSIIWLCLVLLNVFILCGLNAVTVVSLCCINVIMLNAIM